MNEVTPVNDKELEAEILEREVDLNTLGMWVFLSTEVLFFGAMFTAYFIYRTTYPAAFAEASSHMKVLLGSINTFLLLTSSFTMANAVRSAQLRRRKAIMLFLGLTMLLGLSFVGIKIVEYSQEISEGLFPGSFAYTGAFAPQVRLFFSLYFIMTGFHALHMLVGVSLLSAMFYKAWRGQFNVGSYVPVEIVGLFWHFVDIVWIFIFPLLYLMHHL